MKKIFTLLFLLAVLFQPCRAQSTSLRLPFGGSLIFQMADCQIKELEHGFLSSNHLKSGTANINLPDSTHLYNFTAPGDSSLKERTLFTFDIAGKIKTELQYRWNKIVKRWIDFKYENTYDRNGKLTNKHYYGWYIEQFIGHCWYNGIGYQDTAVTFPEEKLYNYEYDQFGRPKRFYRFTLDKYDIPVGTWYNCRYDTDGNKISVYIDDGKNPLYLEEYAYDSNKNLVTITESRFIQYNYISLTFCTSKIKYEFTYDLDNRVSSIQSYYFSFKANEWRNTSKVDYAYQDNGNLDSRLYSIIDSTHNELMPADRTDFKYNKNNKIQCREDYAWSKTTSLWEIRKKLYYYYNNSDPKARTLENLQASETHFCIFPNPVNDVLWIEYTDDINSFLYIYNSKGQCVKTSMMERGVHSIDLSTLAKGIYFYKIDLNNGFNSGTLIVE